MKTTITPTSHNESFYRYAFVVEYCGSYYHGWQYQEGLPTVQGSLEKAIQQLTGESPEVFAAGRTDAGVHSEGQVVHMDLSKPWDPYVLQKGLNHYLEKNHRDLLEALNTIPRGNNGGKKSLGEGSQFLRHRESRVLRGNHLLEESSLEPVDETLRGNHLLEESSLEPVDEILRGNHLLEESSLEPVDEILRGNHLLEESSLESVDETLQGKTPPESCILKDVSQSLTYKDLPKTYIPFFYVFSPSIVVKNVLSVSQDFHARFQASRRRYAYSIRNEKTPSPFYPHHWWIPKPLDIEIMEKGCSLFVGHHNFSHFRHKDCQGKSPWKTIEHFSLDSSTSQGKNIVFHVWGRSFLHRQVRMMVGALIHLGLHRWTLEDIHQVLSLEKSYRGPKVAPAHGLCLKEVLYDSVCFGS